jgi:transmembrane sensor
MSEDKCFDKDYNDLIIRLFNGEIADWEIDQLEAWIKQSDENKRIFTGMKISWMATAQMQTNLSHETQNALSGLDQIIKLREKKGTPIRYFSMKRIAGIAATFLLAVFLGSLTTYLYLNKEAIHTTNNESSIYVYAPMGSKAMTILPDGTKVWLNAGSNLKYNTRSYGKSDRQVTLTGEAFFNVISNAAKPFVVNAKNVKIKALGTEFNVKAYPEENKIETTLVKGIVKVGTEDQFKQSQTITLKPNQQVILLTGKATVNPIASKDPNKIDAKELDDIKVESLPANSDLPAVNDVMRTDLYTSWKDNDWIFKGEEIGKLAILLERRYNIPIVCNSEELKKYRFTGTFQNETLEQVLKVLKVTAPLNYEIGKGIVILSLNSSMKLKYKKYINANE